MNKLVKRLLTGTLAFATILTALPVTAVHASGNQYWTESAERVGYIEQIMNDGSIKSTFHEGHMKVEGETAYCVDINTNFKNGYKTRSDASTRMSSDQIADVALSLEYVKQYTATHTGLNNNQKYLLEQCVVWQRLSEQLGWQCDNVRASYNEISQAVQNEVYENEGKSKSEAKKLAEQWVAIPGTSEHQLGIAVDINADTTKSSSDDVYKWLEENAHTYGFIKRYPSNKTDITGVINEPWHYRYVGKEVASEIYSQGICLEEYIDTLD